MSQTGGAELARDDITSQQAGLGVSPGGLLFFAFLAFSLISLSPFPDLGDPKLLEVSDGNEAVTYFVLLGFALAAGARVWRDDRPALRSLLTPGFIALAVWIGVTSVISQDPMTSMKRAAMTAFVVAGCASLFLLPRDREEMTRLLSLLALLVLAISYFGVIVMPQYAIHQATDLGEPQLAGDWRGVYGHKNVTSAIFSVLSFIGFYVKSQRPVEGWIIIVLSLIFVFASGGKSSTLICLATLLISSLSIHVPSWAALVLMLVPLLVLNLIGVGSVAFPQIGALAAALPVDSSFTGRIDIWNFAVPRALDNPLFGHGFLAFWGTEDMRYGGGELNSDWASTAANAHNGYLDAVISMGFPGLALLVAALVIQPARDIIAARGRADEADLTLMFQRIWMFSLYLSAFETILFNRAHPSWLLMLFAVFALRYLAQFRVRHA